MAPSSEAVAKFISDVDWSLYAGAEYGFVAWQRGATLLNLACRIVAAAQAPTDRDRDWASGDELVIARGWIAKGELETLRAQFGNGALTLGPHTLELAARSGTELGWWRNASMEGARKALGWPGEELLGHGAEQSEIVGHQRFATLEQELLRLTRGQFATLADVGQFLGLDRTPLGIGAQRSSEIAVYAPTYIRLRDPDVDGRKVVLRFRIECRHEGLPPDLVAYVVSPGESRPTSVSPEGWDPSVEPVRSFSLPLNAEPGPSVIHLFAFGRTLETKRVGVPGLAALTHAQLDPGDQWMTSLLGSKGKPTGDAFKHYVATLLQLAGVPVVSYDFSRKGIDSAPDLVAELAPRSILIAECKSAPPSPEEVGTLSARTAAIVNPLGGPWHFEVFKVLFTSVPTTSVGSETLQQAHACDVRIVGRERLLAFRQAIDRGESVHRSLRDLFGIIGPE